MLGLQLEQRATRVVAINVGASTTGGLLGCGLLVSGVGVSSWAAAQLVSSLLTLYFSRIYSKPVPSKARVCTAECQALLKTWYPLVPGAGPSAALPVATPYLLLQTGGAAAAVSLASQFAGVITLLTGGLATAWLPYFQSHSDQQIKWTRTYRLLLHSHLIGSTLRKASPRAAAAVGSCESRSQHRATTCCGAAIIFRPSRSSCFGVR